MIYRPVYCGFTNTMGFGKRLLWLTIALIAFASVGFGYKVVKVRAKLIYVVFAEKFTEPFEVCYLLMYDDTLYKITSNDEASVRFHMDELIRVLTKNGHKISDIMIIIHNHLPQTSRSFSMMDIQTWYDFKMEGFIGNYYMLYQGSNVIYELVEDEDDS